MPLPYDPTPLAAPLPASIDLVEDDEDLDFTSYQDGEFKPAFNAIRYQELHALQDETAAGALGDPDDSNRGNYNLSGKLRLPDNGEQDSAIEAGANTEITVKADGRFVAEAGSIVSIETDQVTLQSLSKITAEAGATLTGTWQGDVDFSAVLYGVQALLGRKVLARPRVALSDADHTVDVTQGDRFTLATNASGSPGSPAARIITLKNTVPAVPFEGETITFINETTDHTIDNGVAFSFQREGGTVLAEVWWETSDVDVGPDFRGFWLTFEYVGGVWKLAESSALHANNDGSEWHYVGVKRVQ